MISYKRKKELEKALNEYFDDFKEEFCFDYEIVYVPYGDIDAKYETISESSFFKCFKSFKEDFDIKNLVNYLEREKINKEEKEYIINYLQKNL